MYKVFIYDKPVLISKKSKKNGSYEQLSHDADPEEIITILNQQNVEGCEVITEHPKKFWKKFKSSFKYIVAAGGTVFNADNELLVIHRLGKWDLPKGKLEKEEDIETCAIREVNEECNVGGLKIVSELESTFHCYPLKSGKWALKRTYWYKMETTFNGVLIPQTEEGIDQVKWMPISQLDTVKANTYQSILEVINSI